MAEYENIAQQIEDVQPIAACLNMFNCEPSAIMMLLTIFFQIGGGADDVTYNSCFFSGSIILSDTVYAHNVGSLFVGEKRRSLKSRDILRAKTIKKSLDMLAIIEPRISNHQNFGTFLGPDYDYFLSLQPSDIISTSYALIAVKKHLGAKSVFVENSNDMSLVIIHFPQDDRYVACGYVKCHATNVVYERMAKLVGRHTGIKDGEETLFILDANTGTTKYVIVRNSDEVIPLQNAPSNVYTFFHELNKIGFKPVNHLRNENDRMLKLIFKNRVSNKSYNLKECMDPIKDRKKHHVPMVLERI